MKKTLSLLITLLLTIATFAYEAEINGIFYDFDHDKQTAIVSHDYFTYIEGDGLGEYSYTQTEIIIPEVVSYNGKEYQVTTIGESAFYYAQALKSVTLPKTINQIDKYAFYGCSSLEQIIIDENNPSFKSIDNILYNKEITTLLVCPATKTEVIIPNSVTKIGEGAFYYCTNLSEITIPNSVTYIEHDAFIGCHSLTSIVIPNSVTRIGGSAFSACISLESIEIPSSVTQIEWGTFFLCKSLKSIKLPNSITEIGMFAFEDCRALSSIVIPESVQKIEARAFALCSALKEITCLNTTPPEAINILADYETCTLVVPNGSLADYQNHEEWGKFKNIQEISNTSYNPIAEDNTQNNICYDAKSHSLSFNIKNQTSISIYDTMGKMLINKSVNPNTTHLYINLNSGIYIVNITTQTGQNNCSKIAVK